MSARVVLASAIAVCLGLLPPHVLAAPSSQVELRRMHAEAMALQDSGRFDEALPWLRELSRQLPNDADAHLALGMALFNASGQTDLRFGPVRFVVPSSQRRSQMLAEAIREMQRAVLLAPTVSDRVRARLWLCRTWLLAGYVSESLLEVSTARAEAPDDPRLQTDFLRATLRMRATPLSKQ